MNPEKELNSWIHEEIVDGQHSAEVLKMLARIQIKVSRVFRGINVRYIPVCSVCDARDHDGELHD